MTVTVLPARLAGSVRAIPAKSHMHRALICASLADRPTELLCPGTGRDIEATIGCLRALGADIREQNGVYTVRPFSRPNGRVLLDCGESGSTLRFLLPLAPALGVPASFVGRGRLAERPLSPLYEQLLAHGAALSPAGSFPLTVDGQLTPGEYRMDGGVSSQFFTGLLLALPLLDGESRVVTEGALASAPYVALTLAVQKSFGVTPLRDGPQFIVSPQSYRSPGRLTVEGDWSNAAFWLVAGALNGDITVRGLRPDSAQGDRAILPLLRQMGAFIRTDGDSVTISRSRLRGIQIDAADIPDLVPALAVAAAAAEGKTVITGAARLRLKESDRIHSVCALLRSLGASCFETPDGLYIPGGGLLGGDVDACNDHRIAMSAAVAACACASPVRIHGAESAEKSYPAFFHDFEALRSGT